MSLYFITLDSIFIYSLYKIFVFYKSLKEKNIKNKKTFKSIFPYLILASAITPIIGTNQISKIKSENTIVIKEESDQTPKQTTEEKIVEKI